MIPATPPAPARALGSTPSRPPGRRLARARAAAAVAGLLLIGAGAAAQTSGGSSNPFGLPPRQNPAAPPGRPTPPPAPANAAPASPAIARVGGRVITQQAFDRLARPYYATLAAQLGDGFTAEIRRMAAYNVLDELVRREVLALEAERLAIPVGQAEIDSLLLEDPFFLTDGRPDRTKLAAYKATPGTNYLETLPKVRELVAINKMDASLRRRFTPPAREVRAEWGRRSDQVRFRMLTLMTRDMPLEPESTPEEWARTYDAHPDAFMRRTRVRMRYLRLPLPAEGDSARPQAEAEAMARGRALADSLRRGESPDTLGRLTDTGPFDLPVTILPGLGRVPGLGDSLARAESDSTYRVVGPHAGRSAVIVGVIAERRPRHLPPLREVLGEVKRQADAEKRRRLTDEEQRAFYAENLGRWRGPRLTLTRIVLDAARLAVPPPPPAEVDRWYAAHGRALFGLPDSSRAWLPPLDDSLRAAARERMRDDRRPALAAEAMGRILPALRSARDARALARTHGAVAETLSLTRHGDPDSLFEAPFADSLLAAAATARGTVGGPRVVGSRWVAWRVDASDTAYVPPYEAVRGRSDAEFAERRRQREEDEARERFATRRDEYPTALRYGLDVIAVPVPPADSIAVGEAELRRRYRADLRSYRQEEQVRARHILFMTRDGGPDVDRVAKARADSLLAAIRRDGGDFAELARRFSQEPGAETRGGDLGWFGRGGMVKEFETAAFALQPGEISPVVKTAFGYHIIRLEERRAAGTRPFEAVREDIRAQVAAARADTLARRTAAALRRRLAAGGDARALAAPHGGLIAATPVTPTEAIPGLGASPELQQALPDLAPGRWAREVYRVGDRYLVVRLRERVAPRPAEFEEVRAKALEDLRQAKRRAALERKVGEIRAALAAGGALDSLAAPYGGLRESGLLVRGAPFIPMLGSEPRVLERAFALAPGEVSDTLEVAQGVAWLRLEEKRTGDEAAYRAAAAHLEGEIVQRRYDEWLEARKRAIRIEILRADLRRPRTPGPRPGG